MKLGMKIACAVMLVALVFGGLGFWFGTLINEGIDKKYEDYTSAIRATTPEEFRSAIENKQNVIATDKLVANETVTHDELDGEYAYISVSHRQKIMKTRIVTQVVNGKSQSRTEIYYEWQWFGTKTYHGDSFSFMGYEFSYDEVDLPERHIKDVDYNGFEQDTYYVVDNNVEGTMFVTFKNDSVKTTFYTDSSIEEAIEESHSKVGLVVFIVLWSLIGIAVAIFVSYKVYWYCE